MPIHLPPLTRRRFLVDTLAAGAGLVIAGRSAAAAESARDEHRFALFSDTHISARRDEVHRGTNMFDNLRRVGDEVLALDRPPSCVMINGDCAFLTGQSDDYSVLLELLRPLREASLPIHLALGNHDHRERFWDASRDDPAQERPVDGRHISIIESPRANWLLLDSLRETNETPGALGESQLAWLGTVLDARADRPAIVLVHHHPTENPNGSGLVDTAALMNVLAPRKQVKSLVFGHTHHWSAARTKESTW